MRIVLPPSETKTTGGRDESHLEWDQLALPELTSVRQAIAEDLVALAADAEATKKSLGLGAKGDEWVLANQELLNSPVMPAIHRYTGVLFDALDVEGLSPEASTGMTESLWLFSALFGPLRAVDPIPRYRLSFDSKLPGANIKSRWQPHAEQIWADDFTIDLRSEGYRALAPLPKGTGVFIRVVKDFDQAAAVGHANKGAKGRLVRDLVTSKATIGSADELIDWARSHGWRMADAPGAPGEVLLALS
ncbi:peroxide stress protein YaaA [Pontimonas sp.]|uniref:YaaA family protein n=1 Tax=Pontimonas sp. TaxID=2304492 RepID=UPI00287041AA|nr:peroxide stress protein YaaA [Pontimonas sp.]MDR9396928.1 peroxide stress protein YaaA [Pontimonas sp.]